MTYVASKISLSKHSQCVTINISHFLLKPHQSIVMIMIIIIFITIILLLLLLLLFDSVAVHKEYPYIEDPICSCILTKYGVFIF